jgi:Spy/CpxP family protein refolding chaperone
MKFHIVFVLLFCAARAFCAEPASADPLAGNLFPPELILQHQSEIGLTDEQREGVMSEIQKVQERFTDLQERLQREVEALAVLLKKDSIEEQAALSQFDKVFNQEREIKRGHLGLLLRIRSRLTKEQVAKLREIKTKIASGQLPSPEERQRGLQKKMQEIQQGAESWQAEGRDPSPLAEIMQEFDPLMKAGKHKEAEALLDRALKLLRAADKEEKK